MVLTTGGGGGMLEASFLRIGGPRLELLGDCGRCAYTYEVLDSVSVSVSIVHNLESISAIASTTYQYR